MREFKFRAYDLKAKEWIKIYTLNFESCYGHKKGEAVVGVSGTNCDEYFEVDDGDIDLIQWTGEKDCKGVDIYEGDIVIPFIPEGSIYNSQTFLVKWDVTTIEFSGLSIGNRKHSFCGFKFNGHEPSETMIVGNKHDNPELLLKIRK